MEDEIGDKGELGECIAMAPVCFAVGPKKLKTERASERKKRT